MKKLLIIGAGFLQDFVIQKSVQLGYETLAVDSNPNSIGFTHSHKHAVIDIVDEKACCAYAKRENIDGVITAATDYGVLTSSYISEQLGLPGLKYSVAKLIKNKYEIRKCLSEKHFDESMAAYEIDTQKNILKLGEKLTYPVMVKPCDGSGSRGAGRVNCREELFARCLEAMMYSRTHRAVIEPFIIGQEYGAECLVENGNVHVLAVMKKWMTKPPYYAELGHSIPSGLPLDFERKIKENIKKAVNALGVDYGAVNIDFLIDLQDKIHIVDMGARMGGNLIGSHIIPLGTGIDYMANLIRLAVGDSVNMNPICEKKVVATKLLALTEGKVKELPNVSNIENRFNVKVFYHLRADDIINEYHTNLDGCGYVVATADKLETAVEHAEMARQTFDQGVKRYGAD